MLCAVRPRRPITLPEIPRAHLDLELQSIPALDRIDLYCIGIVDDRTNDVSENCRCVAVGADHRTSLAALDAVDCSTGVSDCSVVGWSVTWLLGRR